MRLFLASFLFMRRLLIFWIVLACIGNVSVFAKSRFGKSDVSAPVNFKADKLTHDRNSRVAEIIGNVVITYDNRTLYADRVRYDPKADTISAYGNVRLIEPDGTIIKGDDVRLSDGFKKGVAHHITVLMTNKSIVKADKVTKIDDNTTIFHNVTYTRCTSCALKGKRPLWQIRSNKIIHNKSKQELRHKGTKFEFLGIPMLYLPTFSHPDSPDTRKTGFLFPEVSHSNQYGYGLEVPYYFNLAKNYDLTVTPVITSKQGVLMKNHWRHSLFGGEYNIKATGIRQLNPGKSGPGSRKWRGSITSSGEFPMSDTWRWGWDGGLVSDDTYMRRYKISDSSELTSRLYIEGIDNRSYFAANAYHFHGLIDTDNNKQAPYVLPHIINEYRLSQPILGGNLDIKSNMYNLYREEGVDAIRGVTEFDWHKKNIAESGQVITSFVGINMGIFHSNNFIENKEDTKFRFMPRVGVDVRWTLLKNSNNKQHIIEPIVQIIASPNEDKKNKVANEDSLALAFDHTNIFSYNRFSGVDRQEGGVRANIGGNYSLLWGNGGLAKLSLGQGFHLAGKDSFTDGAGLEDTVSDFVAGFLVQPNDKLTMSYTGRFNWHKIGNNRHDLAIQLDLEKFSGYLNYTKINQAVAYGRNQDEEQLFGGAEFRLSNGYSIFGGAHYDIENRYNVSRYIGLGIDCECFAARLKYSEDFDSDRDYKKDRSLTLNIELKTLTKGKISGGL